METQLVKNIYPEPLTKEELFIRTVKCAHELGFYAKFYDAQLHEELCRYECLGDIVGRHTDFWPKYQSGSRRGNQVLKTYIIGEHFEKQLDFEIELTDDILVWNQRL